MLRLLNAVNCRRKENSKAKKLQMQLNQASNVCYIVPFDNKCSCTVTNAALAYTLSSSISGITSLSINTI